MPNYSTTLAFEVIDCAFATCIERNVIRNSYAKVPESVIKKMCDSFTMPPPYGEIIKYDKKFF